MFNDVYISDRKHMEVLPGPFSDFSDEAWERGYLQVQYVKLLIMSAFGLLAELLIVNRVLTSVCWLLHN